MFCRKCGYQLDDGASFCTSCGCKLLLQEDLKEPQMQLEVLSDKPYLSIHEFIRSPYGSHLSKKYNIVRFASCLAILFTVVFHAFVIIGLFDTIEQESDDLRAYLVSVSLVLVVAASMLFARVLKNLTRGSCIGAIVIGFWSTVFGSLFGLLMLFAIIKIEDEYKRFLYT